MKKALVFNLVHFVAYRSITWKHYFVKLTWLFHVLTFNYIIQWLNSHVVIFIHVKKFSNVFLTVNIPSPLFTCPNKKNIGEKNKININSVHIFLFGPRIIPISCSFHELFFHFPFISMYLLDLPNVVGIIICNCHCVTAEYFIPFVVLERNINSTNWPSVHAFLKLLRDHKFK